MSRRDGSSPNRDRPAKGYGPELRIGGVLPARREAAAVRRKRRPHRPCRRSPARSADGSCVATCRRAATTAAPSCRPTPSRSDGRRHRPRCPYSRRMHPGLDPQHRRLVRAGLDRRVERRARRAVDRARDSSPRRSAAVAASASPRGSARPPPRKPRPPRARPRDSPKAISSNAFPPPPVGRGIYRRCRRVAQVAPFLNLTPAPPRFSAMNSSESTPSALPQDVGQGLATAAKGATGNALPSFPSVDPRTWSAGGALTTAGGLAGALFSPVTAATNKLISEPVNQLTGGPQTVQETTPFEGARRGRRGRGGA